MMTTSIFLWIVEQFAIPWTACEGLEESNILRLSILRDAIRLIHAQRSKLLVQGDRQGMEELKRIEDQMTSLLSLNSLNGNLQTSLAEISDAKPPKTFHLPEALFEKVEQKKLLRHDRIWENALVSRGLEMGWSLWSLDVWVEIPRIEIWNSEFSKNLWPKGMIVFTESARTPSVAFPASADQPDLWCGRWIVLLHPEINPEEGFSKPIQHYLGYPKSPPDPFRWKFLFSKAREK